jgi:hypothetical protein
LPASSTAKAGRPAIQSPACTHHFWLLFHMADGSTRQMGYACDNVSPAFLALGPECEGAEYLITSNAFDTLMADLLDAQPALDGAMAQ